MNVRDKVDTTGSLLRVVSLVVFFTCSFSYSVLEPFVNPRAMFWGIPKIQAWSNWFINSVLFFVIVVACYFFGSWFIERRLTLIPLEKSKEYSVIGDIVSSLAKRIGLRSPPMIRILSTAEPTCFVFGRWSRDARLVVSSKMVDILESNELEAVLLHELSHIKNRDMVFMTWGLTFHTALKYWLIIFFSTIPIDLAISLIQGSTTVQTLMVGIGKRSVNPDVRHSCISTTLRYCS